MHRLSNTKIHFSSLVFVYLEIKTYMNLELHLLSASETSQLPACT